MNKNKTRWTIIGGGNGGQSLAGHLSLMGFPVRLYDICPETVAAISDQGGIYVKGAVDGFGKLELATTDLAKALDGAEVVMVVAPATAHKAIAGNCAPLLADGQIVILHPGATCGSLEFRQVLDENGCTAEVTLAETNTLIYACRSPKPGHANILGIKKDLVLASIPAKDNAKVVRIFQEAFRRSLPARTYFSQALAMQMLSFTRVRLCLTPHSSNRNMSGHTIMTELHRA